MKRFKKAGPCILGNLARRRSGKTYVKFPRGCSGFRTFSRTYICANCRRRFKLGRRGAKK